jgi:hypothetical protein
MPLTSSSGLKFPQLAVISVQITGTETVQSHACQILSIV